VARVPASLRAETLRAICSDPAITIFGATNCLVGVRAVVEFVNEAPGMSASLTAAEDAADAMVLAAESGWRIEEEVPDWDDTFRTWMNEIVDSGAVSASLYVSQAGL